MRKRTLKLDVYPLSVFCKIEGVTSDTVLRGWRPQGRAPELIKHTRHYLITASAWAEWLKRRDRDRISTGKPLRAPLAPTPKTTRGKIKWRESLEGL